MQLKEILLKISKNIFLENQLKIVQEKKIQISKEEAAEFYKVHQTKPFYERLCNYLSSGPITVMILEGEDAIKKIEELWELLTQKTLKGYNTKTIWFVYR